MGTLGFFRVLKYEPQSIGVIGRRLLNQVPTLVGDDL